MRGKMFPACWTSSYRSAIRLPASHCGVSSCKLHDEYRTGAQHIPEEAFHVYQLVEHLRIQPLTTIAHPTALRTLMYSP